MTKMRREMIKIKFQYINQMYKKWKTGETIINQRIMIIQHIMTWIN